jgi:hypothetical protein
MSFSGASQSEQDIPNPEEQARVILETCEGDIHEARAIAATNLRFADSAEDVRYWSKVDAFMARLLIAEY